MISFLVIGALSIATQLTAQPPVAIALPQPWGPHSPGVATYVVVDSTRPDAHMTDMPRQILVRIWYPSDSIGSAPRPYMPEAVADAWRQTMPAGAGFEKHVVTNAFADLPLSAARTQWPVLLFSHGRSFPIENYQIALEQLASQGWIIAGISHPYEEALTLLPDGTRFPFRGPSWADESRRGVVLAGVVEQLAMDASRVIDWLHQLDAQPTSPFAGRLDLNRGVGYFGHSLGGAVAVHTLQQDERVIAAASWEGQVYQEQDRPLRVRAPVLYVIAGANRTELMGAHYRPAQSGGPVYELVINGAWHASFGDMLPIYSAYADAGWHARHRRELHPLRVNQITTEYLHEFFGHYMLDADLDLLWPDSEIERGSPRTWNYPEVELRVFGG